MNYRKEPGAFLLHCYPTNADFVQVLLNRGRGAGQSLAFVPLLPAVGVPGAVRGAALHRGLGTAARSPAQTPTSGGRRWAMLSSVPGAAGQRERRAARGLWSCAGSGGVLLEERMRDSSTAPALIHTPSVSLRNAASVNQAVF